MRAMRKDPRICSSANPITSGGLVGRRFTRIVDGAVARVMAEAEGNVMYRLKGAAAHATTRTDFLAKHVEQTVGAPKPK